MVGLRRRSYAMTKRHPLFAALVQRRGQTLIRAPASFRNSPPKKFCKIWVSYGWPSCKIEGTYKVWQSFIFYFLLILCSPFQRSHHLPGFPAFHYRQYHDTCAVMTALAQTGAFRGQLGAACLRLRHLSTSSPLSRLPSKATHSKPKPVKHKPPNYAAKLEKKLDIKLAETKTRLGPHSRVDSVSSLTHSLTHKMP